MSVARSARRANHRSVLDELVFVGRSAPVEQAGEPVPAMPADEDDDQYPPEYVALVMTDADERALSPRERVARAAVLVLLYASIILVIGLAIGYAG